jgi:hypothetical protein
MIRLMLYRALPHRRGEGGSHVTEAANNIECRMESTQGVHNAPRERPEEANPTTRAAGASAWLADPAHAPIPTNLDDPQQRAIALAYCKLRHPDRSRHA